MKSVLPAAETLAGAVNVLIRDLKTELTSRRVNGQEGRTHGL